MARFPRGYRRRETSWLPCSSARTQRTQVPPFRNRVSLDHGQPHPRAPTGYLATFSPCREFSEKVVPLRHGLHRGKRLRVIRAHPDKLELVGISAFRWLRLVAIAEEFGVRDLHLAERTDDTTETPVGANLRAGDEGRERRPCEPTRSSSRWSAAGLPPTLAALEACKDVVLANKEALVLGGKFVMEAARASAPDSSPRTANTTPSSNACKVNDAMRERIIHGSEVRREMPLDEMEKATPEQALAHPNWDMGPKITVDSPPWPTRDWNSSRPAGAFDLPPDRWR